MQRGQESRSQAAEDSGSHRAEAVRPQRCEILGLDALHVSYRRREHADTQRCTGESLQDKHGQGMQHPCPAASMH